MELSHDDVRRILEIVDASEHLQDLELVYGGFRLHVQRGGPGSMASAGRAPAFVPAPKHTGVSVTHPEPAKHVAEPALGQGEIAIRAPMLGTFYRSSAPGEPPFVETGQRVHADDTVCLIEVMKLFNSINAGVDGVVKQILVENGSMIEFQQMIIVIATNQ
ncbi:MAG TPA: acetyl-CoA carboxylase biotin carboxyl carrier protein [Xanthobacteraceae bacterium]|jgi:acetyl-CoA carboxylase biotin carboxyl carrier protein